MYADLDNDQDLLLLRRFHAIGNPPQVKLILILNGVVAGWKLMDGRFIRELQWNIIGRAFEAIERDYSCNNPDYIFRNMDYRLERV